jgi:hypothetical protein
MSDAPPPPLQGEALYKALRQERLDTYKRIWRWFLWLGWPAAFACMALSGKIIGGLHGRLTQVQAENAQLKAAHETAPQK